MGQALAKKKDEVARSTPGQILTLTKDRVVNWLTLVRSDMAPHVAKQKTLAQKIEKLELKVTGDKKVDQKTFDDANALYLSISGNEDDAIAVVDPLIEVAHLLHKGLTTERKAVQDLSKQNKSGLGLKLYEFNQEVDRLETVARQKREREAQAKADKERADRKKQEDEARQKLEAEEAEAAELRKKADDAAAAAAQAEDPGEASRLAQSAAKLEKQAERVAENIEVAASDLAMAEAVADEPVVAEVKPVAPVVNRQAAAFTMVDKWTGVIEHKGTTFRFILGLAPDHVIAHPELTHLLDINQEQLNLIAATQKEAMKIPGCRPLNIPFRRGRG